MSGWQHGLWCLVASRERGDGPCTVLQDRAVRYLIADMPPLGTLSFDGCHELLCVRSYALGLLNRLDKMKVRPHPREAIYQLLIALYANPDMMRAVKKWGRNRFLKEFGPARVGATRYVAELSEVLASRCRSDRPIDARCLAEADRVLRARGLGPILDGDRARIVYANGREETTRTISQIALSSRWPPWAVYLVDPATHVSFNAFCHLRNEGRTFNLASVISAA